MRVVPIFAAKVEIGSGHLSSNNLRNGFTPIPYTLLDGAQQPIYDAAMDNETPVKAKNPGEALCLHYRGDFEKALNYELIRGELTFEPFMMAVKADVLAQPRLAEAFLRNPQSAIDSLLLAAQCKLLPGSKYDLFYLIPRNISMKTGSGWQKIPTVTPLIGYKGLCTMAQRHPRVHSVEAFCVYEGEEFSYEPGSGKLVHKWNPDVERDFAHIVAAYSKVIITEPSSSHPVDQPLYWVMSRKEILRSRDRSEAWKNAEKSYGDKPPRRDSPWHTDGEAMARKTALRAGLNNGSVPRDMGLGGAIEADDRADLTPIDEPATLPPASRGADIRATLGIAPDPESFDFAVVEEAVAAIESAPDKETLEAMAAGWQHLQGQTDKETISAAYARRMDEL